MIKNIVFDLGEVLIGFEPVNYLKPFGFDEDTNQILSKMIFYSKEWNECNAGKYAKNTDILEILCKKNPNYAEEIKMVLTENWVKMLTRKEETIEFLKELKKRNFKIYILSNLSEESHNFIKQYDFFELVDGGVYSYAEKICKPEIEIYEKLLEKYHLNPEETIFMDDNEENIKIARELGIHGIVFHNLKEVENKVEKLIV